MDDLRQKENKLSEKDFDTKLMMSVFIHCRRSYAQGIQLGLSISAVITAIIALIMQLLK